ncbi:hypothetical protein C8Q75DRAFT_805038 [Abortiporus biennis]|nr:hypothetical protein C8Q75DRAFT_805038 [Abortiporus biennis]
MNWRSRNACTNPEFHCEPAYIQLVDFTVAYYDYLLTFNDEVCYIWGCKGSILWIFYINRYFSIFALIPSLIGLFPSASLYSENVCSGFAVYEEATLVMAQMITSVALLLRTFALYRRSRKILTGILSIGLPLIGLISWSVADQTVESHPTSTFSIGCLVIEAPYEVQSHLGFAWIALIIYDVLIFVLTIAKTCKERNLSYNAVFGHVGGLTDLIWRDGAVYFAIMAVFNTANTVTFFIGSGSLSRTASSVSVSLISRLIINLRKQYFSRMQTIGTLPDSQMSMLFFSYNHHFSSSSSDLQNQLENSAAARTGIEGV